MEEITLDELKQEAKDLGIEFSANIGKVKLQEKIDAHYKAQESDIVVAKEDADDMSPEEIANEASKAQSIADRKKEAYKTRVVTIIDNDQRVNGQTTTCIVNCSNMYFDLGTIILPLNMPVEVRQGHLNVLKELTIPQHVKDPKTSLSTVKLVPRYTISYGE